MYNTRGRRRNSTGRACPFFLWNKKIQHRNVGGGGEEEATTSFRELFSFTVKLPSGRDRSGFSGSAAVGSFRSHGVTHTQCRRREPTNQPRPHTHTPATRTLLCILGKVVAVVVVIFIFPPGICVCVRKDVNIYLFRSACVCVCVCLEGRRRLGCNHKLSATVKDHLGRRLIDLLLLLFSSWKTVCVYVYVSRFWH
jgi:hypothetical protein